ncbi:MAG: hypothetical protein LBT11_06245 [Treponema sp.]|jgi:hypothetical protein|nr:hypothetical protein [Treponema sp.]
MKRKILKTTIRILLALVIVLAAAFGGLLIHFNLNHGRALEAEIEYMKALEAAYAGGYTPRDEGLFSDISTGEAVPLNGVRYLATHNSYKQYGSAAGKFMISLVSGRQEAELLKYAYRRLNDQLEQGIRSFELDIRLRKGVFEAVHVPLVDNMSNVMDLDLGLRELRLFSDHHPDHFPVITIFEFKDDWMFLDPALQEIGDEELRLFDAMLNRIFGDKLYVPADFLADTGSASLEEALAKGWPGLNRLAGKFIFVMHPGPIAARYAALDASQHSLSMFQASDDVPGPGTAFIIYNEPDVDAIQALIGKGYMVRTRLDDLLVFDPDRYQRAMESGAQILSSDLTLGRLDMEQGYTWLTQPGLTVVRNWVY